VGLNGINRLVAVVAERSMEMEMIYNRYSYEGGASNNLS